jgi:predicted ester cyclase
MDRPARRAGSLWFELDFPDIRVTEEQVIAKGNMVGVLACWRGTHSGPFFGIEPTGRPVEMRGVVLSRIAMAYCRTMGILFPVHESMMPCDEEPAR